MGISDLTKDPFIWLDMGKGISVPKCIPVPRFTVPERTRCRWVTRWVTAHSRGSAHMHNGGKTRLCPRRASLLPSHLSGISCALPPILSPFCSVILS